MLLCPLLPATVASQMLSETLPPGTLSRDELRACMAQEDGLKLHSQRLDGQFLASNEEAAAIAVANSNLLRESAAGFKDKAARDAYAARSRALEQRIHGHNQRARGLKLALADQQLAQAAYMRACGGRSFLVDDRSAILAERAAAVAPVAAASASHAASAAR